MENPDKDLIGLSREEAEAILNEEGTAFRYDWIDDSNQVEHDLTYNVDRVTMTLRDNKVVSTNRS